MVQLTSLLAVLATSTALVSAHPGQSHESHMQELRERSDYIAALPNRDLAHCVGKLSKRGHYNGMVERRREKLKALRKERGLDEHGKFLSSLISQLQCGSLQKREPNTNVKSPPLQNKTPIHLRPAGRVLRHLSRDTRIPQAFSQI